MSEPMYFPEIRAALWAVENMTQDQLYAHLDILYGREHLPENPIIEQVRKEAVRQTRLDFLNSQHPDYETHRILLERLGRPYGGTR